MKILYLYAVVFISITFGGCQSDKDLIVNKWRPVALNVAMSDSLKSQLFATTILEFTKDGKYAISTPQANTSGTYEITDNGKTLTVHESTSKTVEMTIDTLTKTRFVFTTKADNVTTTAIPAK